jgi:uncharacterized protein
MTDEVLTGLMRNALAMNRTAYAFCWQGGEPTLMGLRFFQRVTDLQQSLATPGSVILNSVQTNGVLIDDALASHFAEYRFLVGVSLDGPPKLHDAHRRTRKGGRTHGRVMAGIDILRRRGAAVNILTLVSRQNAARPQELYRYFVEHGLVDLQFIPLVDDQRQRSGRPLAVSGRRWGEFLCGLFDAWWPHDVGRVSVRHFDAVAARLARGEEQLCTLAGDCRHYLVVEHDGSVYPCDFFVRSELRLGDVLSDSLEDLFDCEAFRTFAAAKKNVPAACRGCPYRPLCGGDCPANRPPGRASLLCEGWRMFFAHTAPRFERLVTMRAASERPIIRASGPPS